MLYDKQGIVILEEVQTAPNQGVSQVQGLERWW